MNRDDSLPNTLWQLTGLEIFHLNYIRLASIPSQIGQLSSLTILKLCHNQLESIPDEIGQLTNLTVLHLENNKLVSITEEIGQLNNLTKLWLQNNVLKKLPKSIGKLLNLEDNYGLNIAFNKLNTGKSIPDSIRKVLSALTKLSKLQHVKFISTVIEKAALCVQRRLVILLAKGPVLKTTGIKSTRLNTKDKKVSFINDVLKKPTIARLICEYID